MTDTRMCVAVPQHVRDTEKGHRDEVERIKKTISSQCPIL